MRMPQPCSVGCFDVSGKLSPLPASGVLRRHCRYSMAFADHSGWTFQVCARVLTRSRRSSEISRRKAGRGTCRGGLPLWEYRNSNFSLTPASARVSLLKQILKNGSVSSWPRHGLTRQQWGNTLRQVYKSNDSRQLSQLVWPSYCRASDTSSTVIIWKLF